MLMPWKGEIHMQSVLIGTYTSGGQEKNGVWRLTLDSGRILDREGVLEAEDPSYLLPVDGGLYYVNERLSGGDGAVGYARKCGGHYERVWECGTGGTNPCHLALSADGRYLAVANYSSGGVWIGRRNGEGIGETRLFAGHGGSVHPQRQEGPHAHFVVFTDPAYLLSADLGADEIRRFRLGDSGWEEDEALKLPAGCGPRHLIPEKDRIMVITELSCELMAVDWQGHVLFRTPVSSGEGTAAALKRDGRNYVTTQRGQDVVRIFSPDGTCLSEFAAGAREPRDVLAAGNMILCACQSGNAVTVHVKSGDTYAQTDCVQIRQAVCAVMEKEEC